MSQNLGSLPPLSHNVTLLWPPLPPLTYDVIYGCPLMCSPQDPRFAGSNPAEIDGFFQDVKILSISKSSRRDFKLWSWVWDSRFVKEPQAWKNRFRSKYLLFELNWIKKWNLSGKSIKDFVFTLPLNFNLNATINA